MVIEANDFLQELVRQVEVLACIQWLSNYQILACIPLNQSVPFDDIADIAGVPSSQLCRVLRMTATVGFLCEPEPGLVAHTSLSSQFFTRPSLLDAVTFLTETALPAALRMADANHPDNLLGADAQPGAGVLFATTQDTLASAAIRQPRLGRQLAAVQRLDRGNLENNTIDALSALDWASLGKATVVDVCPQSMATALTLLDRTSDLRLIVQVGDDLGRLSQKAFHNVPERADLDGRFEIHHRARGTPQIVEDAAVYILHLPNISLMNNSSAVLAQASAELRAHFKVMRANRRAKVILVARVLPEPGTADAIIEGTERSHDLLLLQIADDHALEMTQLVEHVTSIQDHAGRLIVVNKLSTDHNAVVALELAIRDHYIGNNDGVYLI